MQRSKEVQISVIICAVVASCSLAWGKYGGGSGTAASPYLIRTAADLKAIRDDRANWDYYTHYRLMADLDLAGLEPMQPIGTEAQRFIGIFDGNGRTISNLKITASSGNYIGLFGYAEAEIYDLKLVNVEINAPQSTGVGAFAGWSARKFERCSVEGGIVSGRDEVGGLSGVSLSTITQCYTTCRVSGHDKVGGLVGSHLSDPLISQCYSTAAVSGSSKVGGLVGSQDGILTDCYALCDIQGENLTGGLVGYGGSHATIWNCYAAGRFQNYLPAIPGGLSGIAGLTCFGAFWDATVAPGAAAHGGAGKTTAELRMGATFVGWGHNAAWTIDEGVDYPRLAWEKKPGAPLTTPAFPQIEGQGTSNKPYLIRTAQEFDTVTQFPGEWDKHYRLDADIDLAELTPPHPMLGQGVSFTGTFDGNDHSILNFKSPSYGQLVGLFGGLFQGTIKRLVLVNPTVGGEWALNAGALVGGFSGGTIEACGVEGGSVSGLAHLGGLTGGGVGGKITRCYSTSTVTGLGSAEYIGGLAGMVQYTNLNNSYATGAVSGQKYVGGLVAFLHGGSVDHCYSAGRVSGSENVGGLIGVQSSYASSLVTACFWDTQTSGIATPGAGRGLPTAELQKAATFIQAGWDLAGETRNGPLDIWSVDEGNGYPLFFHKRIPEPPTEQAWADDFEDGQPMRLWQVYQPKPDVRLREINGRLEVDTPVAGDGATAYYVATDWALDVSKDFAVKVDFSFGDIGGGEAWVSIGVTPSPANPTSRFIDVTAGCLDGQSVYSGRQAAGGGKQKWWAGRASGAGTLYISYNAASDELYRSFTGYGPVNAWYTTTGLLKEQWAGQPVHVIIGGGSTGTPMNSGQDWLDNFAVDAGDVVP